MIIDDEISRFVNSAFAGVLSFLINFAGDMLSRIIIGIAVGVGTWMITKGISYLIKRLS